MTGKSLDQAQSQSGAMGGGSAADQPAPVDRQADPAHWLPGRALLVVAAAATIALLAAVVVCLLIWTTAPMHPLRIPLVRRG